MESKPAAPGLPFAEVPSARDDSARAPVPRRFRLRPALIVLGVVLVATLLECTLGSLPPRPGMPGMPWLESFRQTLPSWLLVGVLVPAIFALSRRFPLRGSRPRLAALVHVLAALAFPFLHIAAYVAVMRLVSPPPAGAQAFATVVLNLLRLYFGAEVITYVGIAGIWYALHYHGEAVARERDTARLRADLTDARLEALRLQLNPHFLFNTLHAVAVMARARETEAVVRTVNNLADLLRSVLDERTAGEVSLQGEVALLERYLGILGVRFRDRLTVVWDIEDACRDARVPALLLQPLVENAVKHGIETRPGPGTLTIRARRDRDDVEVRIDDTGPGFRSSTARIGHGVGLANTLARLELRWGTRFRFETGDSNGGGGSVLLRFPFEPAGGTPGAPA